MLNGLLYVLAMIFSKEILNVNISIFSCLNKDLKRYPVALLLQSKNDICFHIFAGLSPIFTVL